MQNGTVYLPKMRTQLVAARTVAETVAGVAIGASDESSPIEVAGPREEILVEAARLVVARRGESVLVEAVSNPDDPDDALYEQGALLPGPNAILAGPTFADWVASGQR
jgi:hypothetical protein